MTKINTTRTKTITTIVASLVIGLVLMSPMTILPHANAMSTSAPLSNDAQTAQEKIKSRNSQDKTNIAETNLPTNTILPQTSKSAITPNTLTPGLYIMWGYTHPCFVYFQCDTYIQQTWAPIPFNGAAYASVGSTDTNYPWIKVFYLLQGDSPGTYTGYRSTAVSTPNHVIIYNTSSQVTFFEQYSDDPARVDSAPITNNNNGVPANSQIAMQFTYNNYTP